MSNIPDNWFETSIGEIAESIFRGKSPKYTDYSRLPIINQKSLRWEKIQDQFLKYVDEDQIGEWPPEKYIRENDILWNSTGTGTMGRAYLVKIEDTIIPKVVDSHITIIRPIISIVNPEYLYWWIKSDLIQSEIIRLATGSTNQIELTRKIISELRIPISPIKEQIEIVKKINKITAEIFNCKQRLLEIDKQLQNFENNLLQDAFYGKLANESLSAGTSKWKFLRAEDICDKVQSGGTPKEGFIEEEQIPFLKVYNIVNQEIDFQKRNQFISIDVNERSLSKSKTYPGDVIMNIVGPPLKKVAIIPGDYSCWNINQALVIFRGNNMILSKWIYYVLRSGIHVDSVIHETSGSAGQINISLSQCRNFIFPVPPVEDQEKIIRVLQDAFLLSKSTRSKCDNAKKLLELSELSLLESAFKGKLIQNNFFEMSAREIFEIGKAKFNEHQKAIIKIPLNLKAKKKTMKLKSVKSHLDLGLILRDLGGEASPNVLLSAASLENDIDSFFYFLRQGRDQKTLDVPVGHNGLIKLIENEAK